jgi:hypothetical protein
MVLCTKTSLGGKGQQMTKEVPQAVVLFAPHPKKPETKNCWRFEADQSGTAAAVTSLYIQKWLSARQPKEVRVTVEILS